MFQQILDRLINSNHDAIVSDLSDNRTEFLVAIKLMVQAVYCVTMKDGRGFGLHCKFFRFHIRYK